MLIVELLSNILVNSVCTFHRWRKPRICYHPVLAFFFPFKPLPPRQKDAYFIRSYPTSFFLSYHDSVSAMLLRSL